MKLTGSDRPGGEQALDAEQRLVAERAAFREHGLEVAAEHHGDDRVDVELGRSARAGRLRPFRKTVTRSAMRKTSGRRWVT